MSTNRLLPGYHTRRLVLLRGLIVGAVVAGLVAGVATVCVTLEAAPPVQTGAKAGAVVAASASVRPRRTPKTAPIASASQRRAPRGRRDPGHRPFWRSAKAVLVACVDNVNPTEMRWLLQETEAHHGKITKKVFCGTLPASWGMSELDEFASGDVQFIGGDTAEKDVMVTIYVLRLSETGSRKFVFMSKKPGPFVPLVRRLTKQGREVVGFGGCHDVHVLPHPIDRDYTSAFTNFTDMTGDWLCY